VPDISKIVRNPPLIRFDHIDMLRGLAAGLVLCGHLRAFLFVNYGSLADPGPLTKVFYTITGLGHQAVIIFFAMSGFLVGGKALDDMLSARWSWPRYLLRRLTRLWIVVIPALVATLVFDRIGVGLTGGRGYDGSLYTTYVSGPSLNAPLDHSISTFLGNIAFLQNVCVPIFGTNGPMWSLANEFWYYILFPLAASIFLVHYCRWQRVLAIGFLASAVLALPWWLLKAGLIWATGAGAARVPYLALALRHCVIRIASILVVFCALVGTKYSAGAFIDDLTFGLLIAAVLPILSALPSFAKRYRSLARGVAEISYTLYLTHFPFLALIIFVAFAPDRFYPGLMGAVAYGGLLGLAAAWSVAFWWCFERHTNRLFRYLAVRMSLDGGKISTLANSPRKNIRILS